MKILNQEIKRIAEGIMKTNISSSSLEDKTIEYFRSNEKDIIVFKSNEKDVKNLLKKGDELIHTIYFYCYQNEKNDYIKKYLSVSLEKFEDKDLKFIKKTFKNDDDNSGIFNYKVYITSNDIENQSIEIIGDEANNEI
jgi:hypothetical protein